MRALAPEQFVTNVPWHAGMQHQRYGAVDSYYLAAQWLKTCATVADWGGGTGYFGTCLPPEVCYHVVDGTRHGEHVLANLANYVVPSDGILLRHVLDNTVDWRAVLQNALVSFNQRLVVVTYTPDAAETHIAKVKSGWPIWNFNPDDLRVLMQPHLVIDEAIRTSHPERCYYLERSA